MIHDPKRMLEEHPPAPPTNCARCGRSYAADDRICSTEESGVKSYWHSDCLQQEISELTAESSRRLNESTEPVIVRLRDALRNAGPKK
jgi:hypothetical protein